MKKYNGKRKSVFGKYVLDSLSFGMYNHPFMVIREYIQNSVDAIDDYISNNGNYIDYRGFIDINIDGRKNSIRIIDNGSGIPITKSWHSLHDLGRSAKDSEQHRGFRGIGRLGGLGYCDELVFTTKAEREDVVSKNVWDCVKIRSLVSNKGNNSDISSIIEQSVTFYENKYTGDVSDHFFSVEMNNTKSQRGQLLNVPAIKNYVSQVAPVPFNTDSFSFANVIDKALREHVPSYETYEIRVNGEQIFKPYSNTIGVHDHGFNDIDNISLFRLVDDNSLLAFGWLGEHNFLGMIWPSSLAEGLRLRAGNILIGDKDTLSELYREKRFNSYMIGEIHVVDKKLIPNSRRDDFEDNEIRDSFHSCFIREIGIPYSRKIRELSSERSRRKKLEDIRSICERAETIIQEGYIAESQKRDILEKLRKLNGNKPNEWTEECVISLINRLNRSTHFLSLEKKLSSINRTDVLKQLIEELYIHFENKAKIESIVSSIFRGRINKLE